MHWTTQGIRVEDPTLEQLTEAWEAEMADLQAQAELDDLRREMNKRDLMVEGYKLIAA